MRIINVDQSRYVEPRLVYGINGPIGVADQGKLPLEDVEASLAVRGTSGELAELIAVYNRAETFSLERGKWAIHDRPHLLADEFEVAADLCEKHGLDSVAAALRNLAKGGPIEWVPLTPGPSSR